MDPDRTISEDFLHERMKPKIRMTLLVCANASRSDSFLLMIIGNAPRPRRFKERTDQQLGFDSWNNRIVWMSSFLEWLKTFDAFIRKTPRGKYSFHRYFFGTWYE